ncbi:MAG TPA: hypothetical protein VNT76_24230, partial [Candidatus Binatus sp.]|nr:hypothetical protein [Candidatus Binatus sp.]
AALKALTSGRAGLSRYHFAGSYHTLVLPLTNELKGVPSFPAQDCGLKIRRATHADVAEIVGFVRTQGAQRQFFPCYDSGDLFNCRGSFRGLEPADLLLASRDGVLVGMLGCWQQSSFRQIVVENYDASFNWARPLYNGWAGWRGHAKLPAPGAQLRILFATLMVVQNDDAAVFTALLDEAVNTKAAGDQDYLLVGLHERDPLLAVAQKFSAAQYLSRMYYVCWPDGDALRAQLDDRPPYLELGSL